MLQFLTITSKIWVSSEEITQGNIVVIGNLVAGLTLRNFVELIASLTPCHSGFRQE